MLDHGWGCGSWGVGVGGFPGDDGVGCVACVEDERWEGERAES